MRSLSIDYLRPAAFKDEIAVATELEELGAGQMILKQRISRGAEALAKARVRLATEPVTRRRSGPLEYRGAWRNG